MTHSALQKSQRRDPIGAALLQDSVTNAILRSAILELARVGYARMSMESVTKRAGVGKAALYRRWPNKQAMVIALLYGIGLEIVTTPDTGSLEGDVSFYIDRAIKLLRRPLARRILPDLYAELSHDTELAEAIEKTVQTQKRDSAREIIDRAVKRGELSGKIDYELAFDMLAAPLYWRLLVTRQKMGQRYRERLITMTLGGLHALSN